MSASRRRETRGRGTRPALLTEEAKRILECKPCSIEGAAARAITTLQESLVLPGHTIRYGIDCPCCDPREALDVLHAIMRLLPTTARRQVAAIVEPLSERHERRTLPDPSAPEDLPRWRRRIPER